ncbi:MAG TPA: alanine racemase [Gammaproteobacteria bacterium]|nr:alanine racemase [Gammaproteobacteria bacterium]
MTRPLRARIDLDALQANLALARAAAPASRVLAVIKADAYGHGMVPVAQALAAGVDAFAVASLDEAAQLRAAGIGARVLVLEGLFGPDERDEALALGLDLVVHHAGQVEDLERLRPAAATEHPLRVWLKIDTGMHRLGIDPAECGALLARLQRIPGLVPVAVLSHFACADEPTHPANDRQQACFERVAGEGEMARSLANSAALLTRPDSHFEWVRPGIMLYGASPLVPEVRCPVDLRPVMQLVSALIAVRHCRRGEGVGYGLDWVCPEDMPVGVVAGGYGDGYPRHAPAGTPVLVNGRRVPLVGRVSMDMLCVDLRSQPEARVGDPVLLWGKGLPVEQLARAAGTISYELLCGVTNRVPRLYTRA